MIAAIRRLLNGEEPMPDQAERTAVSERAVSEPSAAERLAALQAETTEIEARIGADGGTAEDHLRLPRARQEVQAVHAALQAEQNRAHRQRIEERRARWLAERDAVMGPLWEGLPKLRHHLRELAALERRMDELGDGSEVEAHTGLPYGTAERLERAIGEELRGTYLGAESFVEEAELALMGLTRADVRPTPRYGLPLGPVYHFSDPAFRKPPPGYSGVWNLMTGRPGDAA
jgi:hypothetical protein